MSTQHEADDRLGLLRKGETAEADACHHTS